MFCRECGAQLQEGARFCHACGAPVAGLDAQTEHPAESQTCFERDDERVQRLETATPESSRPATVGYESGATFADAPGFAQDSLKSAVDKTKGRSRRKVPLIVLVTLVLALAAGVAYAAYTICSNILSSASHGAGEEAVEAVFPAESPVEYAVETKMVTVSTPDDPIMTPGKRVDQVWEYPQISASVESEAVDKINKAILDVVESSKEKVESTSAEERTTTCDMRKISARVVDGVLVVSDCYQLQAWGAHGSYSNNGVAFDLATGEQMSIAEAFGFGDEELSDATVKALQIWESNQTSSHSNPSKYAADRIATYSQRFSKYVSDFEKDSPFTADDEGVWYLPGDYELRPAYRGGRVCVVDFSDEGGFLVGSEGGNE